jgi:16S rRNA (uracil1498-N3)-methyltransferase
MPLVLFNGLGGEFTATVVTNQREQLIVRTDRFHEVERESTLPVRLGQGIARGERMDYVVQKAVELGTYRIEPVLTQRSVVQLEAGRVTRRLARWRNIAINACEQSGRTRIPEIARPLSLESWLSDTAALGLKLVLDGAAPNSLSTLVYPGGAVAVLIGPEGGLHADELQLALHYGFLPVSLGHRTLRTETATVAVLTGLQLRFGDLRTATAANNHGSA